MKNPIIYRILQQGFCLIFCLGLLSSCIREEEFVNNPQGNFEQLWKIIDEQYCFLDYKQIDWDEIHTRYQKLITPNMGSEGLFEVLSEMLYELQDGHVNLASAHNVSYYDAWYQDYPRNFRADLLEDSYLGRASTDYRTAAGLKYKILKDNIGYIRYESFADPVGNGNLDEVLSYLSVCNGLIIDVRDNGGGNATNSARIASRFTNEKILTGYISCNALGVALLGGVGAVAGIGGKKTSEYLIAVEWKNGEKSLICLDDKFYKVFVQSMF